MECCHGKDSVESGEVCMSRTEHHTPSAKAKMNWWRAEWKWMKKRKWLSRREKRYKLNNDCSDGEEKGR